MRRWFGWTGLGLIAACSSTTSTSSNGGTSGSGQPPSEAAPTGQRWEGVVQDDACGRKSLQYILVDEVCGKLGGGYASLDFRAPMFRDGAQIGDHLFAVDGTHLWSLDTRDPSAPRRDALLAGLGQPIAAGAYGDRLLLASGDEGLVVVDVTDPAAPRRVSALTFDGPALDVHVAGDKAYVAAGNAGIAVVSLASAAPTLERTIPVAGYAAAVTTRGNVAYVAACSTFVTVDLPSGKMLAQKWMADAVQNGVLVAPAKDVELVGDTAFVAAGATGAVAVDVSDPAAPRVGGNCTRPEPSFYASGVRASGGKLFVAGGEYGILPVSVESPGAACPSRAVPPPRVAPGASCSTAPPWEVLPWQETWEAVILPPPPPRGWDPIQTLPFGDRVYAFGDARRNGVRAIDVRAAADLVVFGRYAEPRRFVGMAASQGRAVLLGPSGGVFRIGEGGVATREPSAGDATIRTGRLATFLSDGRWAVLDGLTVLVEGAAAARYVGVSGASSMVPLGSELAIAAPNALVIADPDTGLSRRLTSTGALPPSLASSGGHLWIASPEATFASSYSGQGGLVAEPAQGIFDAEEILDTRLWQVRLPRRYLVPTNRGMVEVATLGDKAGLTLHGESKKTVTLALPAGQYVGAVGNGNYVHVAIIERSTYTSRLLTISLVNDWPALVTQEVFSGTAAGLAVAGPHLLVADGEGLLRSYRLESGKPVPEAVSHLELP